MGKFIYALMMMLGIEMGLYFFSGQTHETTSMLSMFLTFQSSGSSDFYTIFTVGIASMAAIGIILGSFTNINIYAMYAIMATTLITFFGSLVNFGRFTYGQLSAVTPEFALFITLLLIAPIGMFYIIAVTEWVRSNT